MPLPRSSALTVRHRRASSAPPQRVLTRLRLLSACGLLLLAAGGCGSAETDADATAEGSGTPVTLALNWFAEAEHGGYIAARELGLYEAAGLTVDIRRGGPGAAETAVKELAAGRIQFAVSSADLVIEARAKGVPVVALAAPLQHSPRCIMVHEASGFSSLNDLRDIELSMSDTRGFALWLKHKVPLTNVTVVPFSGSVGEFLLKQDFAQQGYVFSEPFVAREKGGDPQSLMLSDIGYDPYSSILITTEAVIAEDPELVLSFVQASVAGWQKYLAEPQAINEAIHRDNDEMSLAALAYGVEAMQPLVGDAETGCGMNVQRWQTLIGQLEEVGKIEAGSVTAEACFDVSFLP